MRNWPLKAKYDFKLDMEESADYYVRAFSGLGCKNVEVYDRPTFQQLDHLFRVGFNELTNTDGKQNVVLLAYAGHGQTGQVGDTEIIVDHETDHTFPLEGWLQHLGRRTGVHVFALLSCARPEQ